MKLKCAKILMLIAISILLGHNLLLHNHNSHGNTKQYYVDHDDHGNHVFSFGKLDHNFIISKFQIKVHPDFSQQLFLNSDLFSIKNPYDFACKVEFNICNENLPPLNFHYSVPLRAPPYFII